jgi:hypothetical protein
MNITLQMLDNLSCPYEGDGNEIHPFCNSKVNVNPILQENQKLFLSGAELNSRNVSQNFASDSIGNSWLLPIQSI